MSLLKVDTVQNLAGSGLGAPERNAIINGQGAIAQRATSFTSGTNDDGDYTLDRWKLLSDGNDIVDVTQETTTVPTNKQFAIALDVETTNKKFGITQCIEKKNCAELIGQTVTLSFQAKVSSTAKLDNVKAAIISWSSTADSPTADMISAWGAEGTNPTLASNFTYENTPANLSVTTSYATYSVSAAVDTSSTANIAVFIWSDVTDTTAGHFLYITDVQLEAGAVATSYNQSSYQKELLDCKRYLHRVERNTAYGEFFLIRTYDSTNGTCPYNLPVPMRANPTVSTSTVNSSNFSYSLSAINSGNIDSSLQYKELSVVGSGFLTNGAAVVQKANNTDMMFIQFESEL
tara:strand:- start:715 stop:1755 length:1041 start_codon:yes stop_codon:yes gene_type:complete